MEKKIDLELLIKDVLSILVDYGLHPTSYGVSCTLQESDFEEIANNHPDRTHPELILKSRTEMNGTKWSVQIGREYTVKGYPSNSALSNQARKGVPF